MATYCAEPKCNEIVERGRCPAHTRSIDRERGTFRERGYNARWDRRSVLFRKRYPLCGMRPGNRRPVMSECYERGIVTLAQQVDHVVPHKGNAGLFWDELGNWQSLCAACGARKTAAGL